MKTSQISDHSCGLCGARTLVEFLDYTSLPRVTSDCKTFPAGGRLTVCGECGTIQKLIEDRWLGEIEKIYGEFQIFHQAGGTEQPIFDIGGSDAAPRSTLLIDYLIKTLQLGDDGRVLDFGCGNGAALRSFHGRLPGWTLFGSELSDATLPALEKVPSFVELYTGPPEQIPGTFDLIILIHALEHVINPVKVLEDLGGLLEAGGHVFVEVPDNAQTPYDLLIADHLMHFTPDSLGFATELAGCRHIVLSDSVLPKELTWVGSCESGVNSEPRKPDPKLGMAVVESHLADILSQMSQARSFADSNPTFGVFGTSISATWLSNVLGDKIAFYVDEDPARIGRKHMGRPIFSPAEVPNGADVFLPLIPKVAAAVARRLDRNGVNFHRPAEVGTKATVERQA